MVKQVIAQSDNQSLSGTYKADDGGTYYVRQLGTDLVWVGVSPNDGYDWTNVFIGKVKDDSISGDWTDVPRGHIQQAGTLTLRIYSDGSTTSIEKTDQTGNFGGSKWKKIDPITNPPPPQPVANKQSDSTNRQYTIELDSTYITSKRSAYRDTDFVALAAKIDEQQPITKAKKLGDLDSGFLHPINLKLGPFSIGQG